MSIALLEDALGLGTMAQVQNRNYYIYVYIRVCIYIYIYIYIYIHTYRGDPKENHVTMFFGGLNAWASLARHFFRTSPENKMPSHNRETSHKWRMPS